MTRSTWRNLIMAASVLRKDIGVGLVYLEPANNEDLKKFRRLPKGRVFEITISGTRSPESMRQLQMCVSYVYDNLPEGYDVQFKSRDIFYDWLKLIVGFVDIIDAGKIYKIPRKTNFSTLKDEQEFVNLFKIPAEKEMTSIMNHADVDELYDAAIYWIRHKNDGVY